MNWEPQNSEVSIESWIVSISHPVSLLSLLLSVTLHRTWEVSYRILSLLSPSSSSLSPSTSEFEELDNNH